jgi:hypothetical protein
MTLLWVEVEGAGWSFPSVIQRLSKIRELTHGFFFPVDNLCWESVAHWGCNEEKLHWQAMERVVSCGSGVPRGCFINICAA